MTDLSSRVKALAVEAGFSIDKHDGEVFWPEYNDHCTAELIKFAHAVARECRQLYESESARIKEIAGREDGVFPSGAVVFGIESMRNAGDEAIRARFGLEG